MKASKKASEKTWAEALKKALKNNKPLLITLAGLAGIVLIVVAVALILRSFGDLMYRGDEDAPYPYSWVEKKNGKVIFTLGTGDAEGGAWTLGGEEGGVMNIEVGQTRGKRTKVTMTPRGVGREMATFLLKSGEESVAELAVTVDVESWNERVSVVTSHYERAIQGTVRGGEETGHPFTVRAGEEGLSIFVEDAEGLTDDGEAWQSASSDSLVAYVTGVDVSDEGVTVSLGTRADGTAEVQVYSERDNIAFVFAVEVTDGNILLTDSRTEAYQPQPTGEEIPAESPAENAAENPAESAGSET